MSPRELIDQRDALRLLLAAIAGNEPSTSRLEVRSKRAKGGMSQAFFPVREPDRAARAITNLGQLTDVYVGAAPRVRECGRAEAVERVWTLWADCDSPEAVERLRKFRPSPSIVLRSGSGGAHAWWPLREPLPPAWAVVGNRRLALKLGADRKSTDSARVLRAPGTRNFKHDPPRPVGCVRLELAVFTAGQVVGGLPDEPVRLAPAPGASRKDPLERVEALARFVLEAQPGERNTSLFWAACRVAEDDLDGLDQLRDAALATGLDQCEIETTLQSARRTAA